MTNAKKDGAIAVKRYQLKYDWDLSLGLRVSFASACGSFFGVPFTSFVGLSSELSEFSLCD